MRCTSAGHRVRCASTCITSMRNASTGNCVDQLCEYRKSLRKSKRVPGIKWVTSVPGIVLVGVQEVWMLEA
eukprot:3449624-Rhodomonas_salina.1